jgi:hypothetical protein
MMMIMWPILVGYSSPDDDDDDDDAAYISWLQLA